jgi:hypothetical protein
MAWTYGLNVYANSPRFVREGLLRSHCARVDPTGTDTVVDPVLGDIGPKARTRLRSLIDQRTVDEH